MGAGMQADGGTEKEKVLRKGKQVVTPSTQPASQSFAVSCVSDVRSCSVTNSQGMFTAHCAA